MVGDERSTAPPGEVHPGTGQNDPFGALRSGTQIGKYEIVEVLGQGGFGITYRARDAQLRRDVAIKEYLPTSFAMRQGGTMVLPRSTQTAEDFLWGRERFLDEARTLASLEDAPGIVNVYDFMEANGTAYMVMALVRGETLESRLKRDRRLAQPAIEQLLYPLLDGLEKVHEAGFLHRDIKPANILLDGNGRPTLIDFGASRVALQGRTQALTAVYTPGYAAFEQSTSAKQGSWTDIYALAATLYHCITGAPPPAASDRMIDDRLVSAAEAGKGRYAPSLLAAIDAGLKLKATERPTSVADWRRVLSGIGGGRAGDGDEAATREMDDATRRLETPAMRQASPPAARQRLPMTWIAAGIVALAVAGGGAWLILRSAPETPVDELRRVEAEAQRQAALAAKLRQEEEERQRVAAETRRQAEAEAARKVAEEKAAADAAARRQTEAAERERAAAVEARRQAEAEAARKAAEEKAAAEAVARRKAEEDAAARAAVEAAQRRAAEQARAEAETRRRAEEEVARKAAEEKAAVEAAARRKAEDEAAAEAARRRAEEQARAEVEARRKAEEDARRAADEKARAEIAARDKATAEEKAAAEAAARRKAEEETRRAAEEKAKTEAEIKRQAEAGEVALRLSEADRKRVQVALTALGHNTQGSDGAFGPRTRQMIAAWQKSQAAQETGYLTSAQLTALRQQAAPALARYDEEQKKIEDDKRKAEDEAKRKQEEDAKKRAEEERRGPQQPAVAQPSVAAAPSTTAPAAPPGAPFDGRYSGEHCSAPRNMPVSCGPAVLVVQAGIGSYGVRVGRCNKIATMTVKVDPSGSLAGTWSGFSETCESSSVRVWGRVSGNRVAIESGNPNVRANFTRK